MERPYRIMIVEDSETQALKLRYLLEQEGWEVSTATTAEAALEALNSSLPDLIVVDYHLPGIAGDELCRRIRMNVDTRGLPILMLTAEETHAAELRGLESGADDYIPKSADPDILLLRIHALLRKAQAQARAALAEKLEEANRGLEEANRKLKETQTHLVQSEKMASLGQLVAGVAHEINNPLSFALNNVFTVDRELSRLTPEVEPHLTQASIKRLQQIHVYLKDMREGLERVRDLVLKLRTFSRLDEGEFKTVDIHEGLDSVLLFLHHRMKNRIEVERRYGPDGALSCYAGQLNQVLMNVIANALDAIEGRGKITITTGRKDGMFVISVRDSGKGIPEEVRGRIFEPFFTTKPVGQGTGLGLAISYGIIQAHRGSIEVHSEEGRGTEFVIQIPLDLKGGSGHERTERRD